MMACQLKLLLLMFLASVLLVASADDQSSIEAVSIYRNGTFGRGWYDGSYGETSSFKDKESFAAEAHG
jgi:hypothetical protein